MVTKRPTKKSAALWVLDLDFTWLVEGSVARDCHPCSLKRPGSCARTARRNLQATTSCTLLVWIEKESGDWISRFESRLRNGRWPNDSCNLELSTAERSRLSLRFLCGLFSSLERIEDKRRRRKKDEKKGRKKKRRKRKKRRKKKRKKRRKKKKKERGRHELERGSLLQRNTRRTLCYLFCLDPLRSLEVPNV